MRSIASDPHSTNAVMCSQYEQNSNPNAYYLDFMIPFSFPSSIFVLLKMLSGASIGLFLSSQILKLILLAFSQKLRKCLVVNS